MIKAAETGWKSRRFRLHSQPTIQSNAELLSGVEGFRRKGWVAVKERHLVHVKRKITVRIEYLVEVELSASLSLHVLCEVSCYPWWLYEKALIVAETKFPVNCRGECKQEECGEACQSTAATYLVSSDAHDCDKLACHFASGSGSVKVCFMIRLYRRERGQFICTAETIPE